MFTDILSKVRSVSKETLSLEYQGNEEYSEEEKSEEQSEEYSESELEDSSEGEFEEESEGEFEEESEGESEEESEKISKRGTGTSGKSYHGGSGRVAAQSVYYGGDQRKKLIFVNNGDNYYIFGNFDIYANFFLFQYNYRINSVSYSMRKNYILEPPQGYDRGFHFGPYKTYTRVIPKILQGFVDLMNSNDSNRFSDTNLGKLLRNTAELKPNEIDAYQQYTKQVFNEAKKYFSPGTNLDNIDVFEEVNNESFKKQMEREKEIGRKFALLNSIKDPLKMTDVEDNRVAIYCNDLNRLNDFEKGLDRSLIHKRGRLQNFRDNRSDAIINGEALFFATSTRIGSAFDDMCRYNDKIYASNHGGKKLFPYNVVR